MAVYFQNYVIVSKATSVLVTTIGQVLFSGSEDKYHSTA